MEGLIPIAIALGASFAAVIVWGAIAALLGQVAVRNIDREIESFRDLGIEAQLATFHLLARRGDRDPLTGS